MLAENGANSPNHARHVEVADEEQGSVQRSFDVDAVAGEQARRTSMQHGGARSGVASAGMQGNLEHRSRTARSFFLLIFVHPDATLGGHRKSVDAIYIFRVRKHALNGCVAD